jgi:diaminohydroxyphosphoribosylaminopyrimidine deaminase/5-amino-6-(5-phosphoribosylamino)uracil reductase
LPANSILMDSIDDPGWGQVLAARAGAGLPTGPLASLYAPVCARPVAADGCLVFAHIAQSLDGRIATESGSSRWISGQADLLHTHRLRALAHAVVVGAGTVLADDPQLTVRHCSGPSPVRVVIDTERRLDEPRLVFAGGPETLVACADDRVDRGAPGTASLLTLPRASSGGVAIPALLQSLAARGLTHVFVEGGAHTIGRFLAAGCLDRLHVAVAPLLLGSGIATLSLPPVATVAEGLRAKVHHFPLGDDMLFDLAIDRRRFPA